MADEAQQQVGGASRDIVIDEAISHLRATIRLLDFANESLAAIHVSHALALIDGTGGAVTEEPAA